jgi:hypothetical protein
MSMNAALAAQYGTPGLSAEDHAKVASANLFVKVAAEQGVDLKQFSDAQLDALYRDFLAEKTALDEEAAKAEDDKKPEEKKPEGEGAPPPFPPAKSEDKPADKGEKPEEEDAEKKEAAAEFARKKEEERADFLGRKMAHAYVQELGFIADSKEKAASAAAPAPEAPAAAPVAPLALGKEASATDRQAAKLACELAKEAGYDVETIAQRLEAFAVLGQLPESTKTAAAANVEQAIAIRAYELLEAAGVEVSWE